MKSKFPFPLLKALTAILFYAAVALSILVMAVAISHFWGHTGNSGVDAMNYDYEVRSFGLIRPESPSVQPVYSADSLLSYRMLQDHYTVRVSPGSVLGYEGALIKLAFLLLVVTICWNFKQIFKETSLEDPFKKRVAKRLKNLAFLFIAFDLVKILQYVLVTHLMNRSFGPERFSLITTVGNNFLIALIIWAIALVYQRGISLKEENALTV